jgi:hypothetical protein
LTDRKDRNTSPKPERVCWRKKNRQSDNAVYARAEKYWSVKNWDNLQIPKPFSRACVFIAESQFVEPDADDRRIDECGFVCKRRLTNWSKLGNNGGQVSGNNWFSAKMLYCKTFYKLNSNDRDKRH